MKVILLDDFHSLIPNTLQSWGWDVVNAKDWGIEEFKKKISRCAWCVYKI
jgi:hypothetical protein